MNVRTRLLPGALALALAASACVTDDAEPAAGPSSTDLSSSDVILTSASLQTLGSCDALLDRLIVEGLERVGPYGFGGGPYWGGPFETLEEDAVAPTTAEASRDSAGDAFSAAEEPAAAQADAGSGEGGSFSTTNNQEVDVDEADLVKTDGKRLVVLNGNTLRVIDVTGSTPVLERTIDLGDDTWADQMFLVGDRVLLLSQGWTNAPFFGDAVGRGMIIPEGSPTSRIIEVDLTNGRIGQTIEFEGSYLSAREVAGSIRVVLSSGIGRFPFLFPSNSGAEEEAEAANRRLIEESTIEQWLPSYRITEGGQTVVEGAAVDCDRMHLPSDFSGFGSLTVLTVDLDDGLDLLDALGVVTDGQTVYASTDRLTVATAISPDFDPETGELIVPDSGETFTTAIHAFDITDASRTDYVASGSVRGSLLSQYSLSEYEGYLRVATTDGAPWARDGGTTESFVSVFEEADGELRQIGQVGGLGEGEQIFSVRFMGDVAFVVTFRQVDPLYTVDLSEPANPTLLGELKIPGFSSYLHPIGQEFLLGVGQDATDEGQTTGGQVSLFDVSNLATPQRVDQLDLGRDSYSNVQWDPKSFLYWAAEDLAVVPVNWWRWNEADQTEDNGAAAVLIRIGEDGTLTEIGRIDHPRTEQCEQGFIEEPLPAAEETTTDDESTDAEASFVEPAPAAEATSPIVEDYCWNYQPEIRRSVVIDTNLYSVSDAGVKVNALSDLSEIAWLPFT